MLSRFFTIPGFLRFSNPLPTLLRATEEESRTVASGQKASEAVCRVKLLFSSPRLVKPRMADCAPSANRGIGV